MNFNQTINPSNVNLNLNKITVVGVSMRVNELEMGGVGDRCWRERRKSVRKHR